MEAVEKSALLRDEMIMELLELLKQNSMPQEYDAEVFEIYKRCMRKQQKHILQMKFKK